MHNLPLHLRKVVMQATLSHELREKHKMRNIGIRKGDRVRVMRGSFSGKTGRIERVDTKLRRVYIGGVELAKRDGTKMLYPINPSKLMIQELELKDSRRLPAEKAVKGK